jgi:hypothetical protein
MLSIFYSFRKRVSASHRLLLIKLQNPTAEQVRPGKKKPEAIERENYEHWYKTTTVDEQLNPSLGLHIYQRRYDQTTQLIQLVTKMKKKDVPHTQKWKFWRYFSYRL